MPQGNQALPTVDLGIDGRQPMRERCSALRRPQPHRNLPLQCSPVKEMRVHGVCFDLAPRCAADTLTVRVRASAADDYTNCYGIRDPLRNETGCLQNRPTERSPGGRNTVQPPELQQ